MNRLLLAHSLLTASFCCCCVGFLWASVARGQNRTGNPTVENGVNSANVRTKLPRVLVYNYLRARSPFPRPYAYLFVLLVVAIGAKFVQFPWIYRVAVRRAKLNALAPDIDAIRQRNGSDSERAQEEIDELLAQQELDSSPQLFLLGLDVVSVSVTLMMLSSCTPEMRLDGSRLLWTNDVTAFDWSIAILWVLIGLLCTTVTAHFVGSSLSMSQHLGFYLLSTGAIVALAYTFSVAAYLFVFWTLLTFVGLWFTLLASRFSIWAGE